VKPVAIPVHFEATGTLAPRRVATLASQIMGTVTGIAKREGEAARSGEVLVTIDDTALRADLAAVEASLDELDAAQVEIDKNLIALGAGKEAAAAMSDLADPTRERFARLRCARSPPSNMTKVEAEAPHGGVKLRRGRRQAAALASKKVQPGRSAQALANRDKIRAMIGYASILAPFDGLITRADDRGRRARRPGAPLVRSRTAARCASEALVPRAHQPVKLGDTVPVSIDSAGIDRAAGRVDEIVPIGDPMSRTFTVKSGPPADPRMKGGMHARGLFPKEEAEALLIPAAAVERRGQMRFVRMADGGRRFVREGTAAGGMVEILSGLAAGERIALPR
jgi:multidrug efflux pump subunit AcrA (membrane-fusion protein)